VTELLLEKIIATYGVPVGFVVFMLYQIWKSPSREDPTKKIMDRLDDIKEIQIDHGNRLTKVETILEERK
jgi:tetrahydromethanopterin S-methyltransferase subunit G